MSNLSLDDAALDLQQWAKLLDESVSQLSDWVGTVFMVSLLLIFVVGVVGNLLTCIVIYFDRTMHTATNYYLFTLAISDLLLAFGILLEITSIYNYETVVTQQVSKICKVHFFLVGMLFNNGVWIMTALAIERYIAIWHPMLLNSRPVWKRVLKIIILIWTVAILEALPELWTVALVKTQSFSVCFIVPSDFAKWLNGVLAVCNFVVPLIIMIFVYAAIAFKVNVTQKRNMSDKVFNHRNSRSKVNKLIVALTLSFVGCWLPFFTMRVFIMTVDLRKSTYFLPNWDLLFMLSIFNSWLSIVLNPLLFSLMSTKFRKALKTLWNARFKRELNVTCVQSQVC